MNTKQLSSHCLEGALTICLIPVILFSIFCLPSDIRELLVLRSDSLNVLAFFTCHFVHEDFANHLLPNILAYFVAVVPLYWFLLRLNEKKLFYKLFFFNCLVMPFILSLIWIEACAFWNIQTRSLGFSGINSAFLGALIFAYVLLLHERLRVNTSYASLSAMFFAALIFTLTYSTLTIIATTTIAAILLTAFIAFAYKTKKSIDPQAKNKLQEKIKNPKIAAASVNLLLPFLYLLIFLFSLGIFPTQIIQGNITINVFIHYTGFVFGIGAAQLMWQPQKPHRKLDDAFGVDKDKVKPFTEEDRGEKSKRIMCNR